MARVGWETTVENVKQKGNEAIQNIKSGLEASLKPPNPLTDVAQRLKNRQRYIEPTIRNLNTGEVYTSFKDERIEKCSRRPINQRRIDVGEMICKPCLQFISSKVTPNQIT